MHKIELQHNKSAKGKGGFLIFKSRLNQTACSNNLKVKSNPCQLNQARKILI